MNKYPLDKIFVQGTTYRAESDKGYVIRKVGTGSTTKGSIVVAGGPTVEVVDDFAPLAKLNTNLFGLFDLGDYPIVVPPDRTLEFTGTSGAKWRLVGEIIELAPGEVFPEALLARYHEQNSVYWSYKTDSYSHGTDTDWGAGVSKDVLEFTVPAGEMWRFNSILAVSIANVSGGLSAGQFGIVVYKDDKPFDLIETTMGMKGLDAVSLPLPPKEDVNFEAFSLKDFNWAFEPGRTLRIACVNVSGSDISPSAGTSITVTALIVGLKKLV